MRSKTAHSLALLAILTVVLIAWSRRPRTPHSGHHESEVTAAADADGAQLRPEQRSFRPPLAKPTTFTFGRPNPIIDRVLVDKTEVCRGEENFVHVDVDTVDGTETDLKIWLAGPTYVGGNPTGGRLPIRMFAPMNADAPPMVLVAGWGGTHAEQPLPFVRVKDCNAGPYLKIHAGRIDGADLYEFSAEVAGHAFPDVTWSFGDGPPTLSREPTVQHGFEARPQHSAYAEYLITATATDDTGTVLRGYQTLELVNRDYWRHRNGS